MTDNTATPKQPKDDNGGSGTTGTGLCSEDEKAPANPSTTKQTKAH